MSIGEEQVECPLCMEPLEMDDINFYPCTCGYQICRFCWNRIRTDENGLCPACRKSYPEDPAAFKPLTEDELQRIKRERKMKDLQRKQKAAENRKHLANVRVVQKNLVFAVGLSQRLADTEVLKKHDYFGKFGKIVKVVINQSTSYAGSQGPSASAYITYQKAEDALRAIQAVNNIHVDGRTIKASLGTTKYCSHFLRGTQCPKPDCMYLHELGDEAASFTKEEMQQGKHQEYEQKLYEQYMNHLNTINATNHTTTTHTHQQQPVSQAQQQQQTSKSSNQTRKKNHSPATTQRQTPPQSASQNHNPDAWPSLHTGGQQTQHKPSTDRTTNCNKAPPTSHSNLSNSFGSSNPSTSSTATTGSGSFSNSSSSTGATHKRNLSSDLQHSGGNRAASASTGQRQTRTPDPHTTHRVQHSVTEGSSTQSQHQLQSHQTNNPTPPQSLVNNCTPPQLSPPQIQTPPSQVNNRQTSSVGSPKSPQTQPMAPQRKPLYGDSNTESLSLFSNSGFPVGRHPLKHPGAVAPGAVGLQGAFPSPATEESKLGAPEIPDTISVSSSTDWQAAFGFQPSSVLSTSRGMVGNGQPHQPVPMSSRVLSERTNHNSVQDNSADDDLGFDPWNESTKGLQALIEKEAVSAASGKQHAPTSSQLPPQHSLHHRYHHTQLPQTSHQQHQHMLGHEQNKPIPPGFSQNHLSAFSQNPLVGGSHMVGVGGKFPPSSSAFPHNGGLDSDLSGLCGGSLPPRPGGPDSFNMKSWQEGLRALLPNINIHFGNPQGSVPLMNPPATAGASGLPQQPAMQPANQKTVQPQKSPQNSWDLTSDPAIVTSGNIADGPEEPHWMASLHHLTEDSAPSQQQQPAPQQNLPYSSRFLPLGLRHNPQAPGGGAPFPPQPTAPPPGFQNTIRPPPHLASGMLESHKQLMDAFQ